jgi:hypothetical protein
MWTSIPILSNQVTGSQEVRYVFGSIKNPPYPMLPVSQGLIPNDVTIKIRVTRPYAPYSKDSVTINNGYPYYTFSTEGMAPVISNSIAKGALDMVNIVPNPYYAFSTYEDGGNALDTRVKITNLPNVCTVNIYTLDGVLVRSVKKDDPTQTYLVWDMKNDAKVPINSGVYLIHIKATELGEERVVKFFAVMRPADYDSF